MKKLIFFFIIALFGFISFTDSYAQNDRDDFKQKLDQVRKEKFIEKIKVDDATADRYFQVTNTFMETMKDLNQSQRRIMKSIEDNPDASDIESKLNQFIENEAKIGNVKKEYYESLKTFLTPKQVAQTIIFQRQFMKKLKNEVDKRRGKDKKKRKRD
ncbi:MAG TPA: hypothetical protein VHP32_09320 [Ignavibacteria bacterium]|nr:hypothetical protein [Ignavibacteria bacterium]